MHHSVNHEMTLRPRAGPTQEKAINKTSSALDRKSARAGEIIGATDSFLQRDFYQHVYSGNASEHCTGVILISENRRPVPPAHFARCDALSLGSLT